MPRRIRKDESSSDECPKCGGVSYRGGYCFSCDTYRPSKPSAPGEAEGQDMVDYLKKSFGTRLGGVPLSEEELEERETSAKMRRKGRTSVPTRSRRARVTISEANTDEATILVQAVVETKGDSDEGRIISALEVPWRAVVRLLKKDWSHATEIPPDVWEQMVAAAFDQEGYEVTLTPRSGDYGRDVIAEKGGVGSIRIIDSVKAYKPGHLVKHDDVRALAGVLSGDQKASKGILSTTSDFAPNIKTDPYLSPMMPTRLELMNGSKLRDWLATVAGIDT